MKVVVAMLAGLVVVAVMIGLLADDLHQRHRVDQERARAAQMARTDAAANATANAAVNAELAGVRQQLQQNQKDLDAARSAVTQQNNQLDELKKCLAGVSAFFDRVSAGDQQGAVTAINGVQPQCDAADKLIGQ